MSSKKNIVTGSAQELAGILGITDRRVQQLVPEVFTREGRGAYDLAKCVQAYITYQVGLVRSKTGTKEEEETRWTKLRADKVDLEIRVMNKELIPAEAVGAMLGQVVAAARSKFLALPSSIKTKRPDIDVDVISFVETEIRSVLEEMADADISDRAGRADGEGSKDQDTAP